MVGINEFSIFLTSLLITFLGLSTNLLIVFKINTNLRCSISRDKVLKAGLHTISHGGTDHRILVGDINRNDHRLLINIADNLLVVLINWADVTEKVNTVNIEFSADPKEGKAVGSDYSVKITPDSDAALKEGRPLINLPAAPANILGTYDYNAAYVAVYESNNLLYPGYLWRTYNTAPQRAPANGSDPTGALGARGSYAAGNYALGKSYKYYAIFEIDGAAYAFDANTVFNVNGVKATDVTLSADGKSAQVFVGEKSATELVVPHQHSLIHFPAVAATTEKEGNVEYWYCDGCKKNFGDAAGNQQLEKVTIEKLTPTTPSNPQNPQGGEDQKPAKTGSCKYCGEDHTGFAGFFIKIIHSILALFGLRK